MKAIYPSIVNSVLLSVVSAFLWVPSAMGKPIYETEVVETIDLIQEQEIDRSIDSLQHLLKKYPNSKLGHLILGDLLSVKAGNRGLLREYGKDQIQHNGLRDEIRYRWDRNRLDSPALSGLIPSNLILSPDDSEFVLVVDASQSRLFIYSNQNGQYQLVEDYYVTVGKAGMGKEVEGDLRTPVGIYHVTSYLPGEELPPRYGPGAFPINYPNELDKMYKRTGYGIWFHGTEPENHNRVPLASDGCVSLSNEEFVDIAKYVDIDGSTPVVISPQLEWVDPSLVPVERENYKQILKNWEADWESLDTDKYLTHYSKEKFRNGKHDYDSWAEHKRRVNKHKEFIDVNLENLSIYTYPGEDNMFVAAFNQVYKSDGYSGENRKKQYWKKDLQGAWKIIYEG